MGDMRLSNRCVNLMVKAGQNPKTWWIALMT